MRRTALALVALLASAPVTEAVAQATERAPLDPVTWPQDSLAGVERGPSTVSRIATGIGGALLGTGLGFFVSQVVQGDWQDGVDGQAINRSLWAVIGGSVGLTVGFRFPLSGGQGASSRGGLPTGRDHLGLEELQGRSTDNAYNAIAALRPEWLQIRGNRSLSASVDPVVADGTGSGTTVTGTTPLISESETIQVYIDGVNAGGLDRLNSVNIVSVRDMYFLDTARATARWGGHNPHGAILIIL